MNANITKDFNGLPIIFREDGYINGTHAARQLGKDIWEFFKLDSTKQYMKALEKMMGIPLNIQKPATRGRSGSTYIHPKLAVRLNQWLDVRFAVWCDLMIDNILQGNIQTAVVVPTKEAVDVGPATCPCAETVAYLLQLSEPRKQGRW